MQQQEYGSQASLLLSLSRRRSAGARLCAMTSCMVLSFGSVAIWNKMELSTVLSQCRKRSLSNA